MDLMGGSSIISNGVDDHIKSCTERKQNYNDIKEICRQMNPETYD